MREIVAAWRYYLRACRDRRERERQSVVLEQVPPAAVHSAQAGSGPAAGDEQQFEHRRSRAA